MELTGGGRRDWVNMEEFEKWYGELENAGSRWRGGLIGSPETIRRKLRKFAASNIDQVILLNQAGKNSHEHICDSLDLFYRMPEFHAWRRPSTRRGRRALARDRARRSTSLRTRIAGQAGERAEGSR